MLDSASVEELEEGLRQMEPIARKRWRTTVIGSLLLILFEVAFYLAFEKYTSVLVVSILVVGSLFLVGFGFYLRRVYNARLRQIRMKLEEMRRSHI